MPEYFSPAEVCAIAGIDRSTPDKWRMRGIWFCERGWGDRYWYGVDEMLWVACVAMLRERGLWLREAAKVAPAAVQGLAALWAHLAEGGGKRAPAYLAVWRNPRDPAATTIRTLTKTEAAKLRLIDVPEGHQAMLVDLDKLTARLAQAAREMQSPLRTARPPARSVNRPARQAERVSA